jgi:hypothetical protein
VLWQDYIGCSAIYSYDHTIFSQSKYFVFLEMINSQQPEIWKDIVKDWETIPIGAYEFLFSQAKDRYDEVMSESESITNKSINLLTIAIGAITGFVGYNFTSNPSEAFIVLLTLLFIPNFIALGILLFPKNISQRGSPPNEVFIDYLDNNGLIDDEKTKLVYYHELIRYQTRLEFMNKKNSSRHYAYGIALVLTLLVSVCTGVVILSTIYHP